jgi:hypothetical protein
MNEHEPVDCSYVITYLAGECTELERAAFERHLRTCVSCRDELRDLQAVWQVLPYQMEEVELPPDLKQQVMNSITKTTPVRKRSFTWVYGSVAVVILGIMAGAWWNFNAANHAKQTASDLLNQPAQIVNTFILKSADSSMPTAAGTAWILQHGNTNDVVVHLNGLKETKGEWAYQVWLNHSGKKYNCGTLRVDDKGNGVLTYNVLVKDLQIDSIGVTLEPDPNGSQPRGKKVLGT